MKKTAGLLLIVCVWFGYLASPAWAMAKKPPVENSENLPPLGLPEAYTAALKQSEVLAIKQVEVEKTWADFLRSSAEALGDVDYVWTDFRQDPQKSSSGSSFGNANRYETRGRKLVISQPLFQGFKSLAALKGSGSLRQSRVYDQKRAEQILFAEVAAAFYAVQRYAHEIKILENTITLYQDRIVDLEKREKIGRSRISEVTSALTRRQNLEADLAESQGLWAVQVRLLEFLTGLSLMDRPLRAAAWYHESPKDLGYYLPRIEERYDVRAAKAEMKTYFQNVMISQSALWPKITLDNNVYDQREGFQSGTDWDILFTVTLPLFRGGGTLAELKESYSEYKEAKLTYQKVKREAELDLKKSYTAWITSQKQFLALEKSVETSEENYRLQKEDYNKSLVSNLEVLAALESYNENRQRKNSMYYQLQQNYWNFQIAWGNCCEST